MRTAFVFNLDSLSQSYCDTILQLLCSISYVVSNRRNNLNIHTNIARMMTIVTERLSESLVAASHYFGWSLADMVVAAARKALSSHPKHTQWPTSAVEVIEERLTHWKEFEVYDAANRKLDQRISALTAAGVNVTHELHVLKVLQSRVTEVQIKYNNSIFST